MILPRTIDPPPELKERVAAALRRNGLLRRRRRLAFLLPAAAAAILIAVFFLLRPDPPPSPNYILLLYDTPQVTGGNRQEYAQWARAMSPLIAGGEELGEHDVMTRAGSLTPLPPDTSRLAGYFLIAAPDDARAAAVAAQCPHLAHGGAVVLRKIVSP